MMRENEQDSDMERRVRWLLKSEAEAMPLNSDLWQQVSYRLGQQVTPETGGHGGQVNRLRPSRIVGHISDLWQQVSYRLGQQVTPETGGHGGQVNRLRPSRIVGHMKKAAVAVLIVACMALFTLPSGTFADAVGRVAVFVASLREAPIELAAVKYEITAVPSTLEAVVRDYPDVVHVPTYLPPGAQLVSVFTEGRANSDADRTIRLDYTIPPAPNENRPVYIMSIRVSRPTPGVRIYVDPDHVVDRIALGDANAILYSPGGPDTGARPLILSWGSGELYFEIHGTLPANEFVKVAASLRPANH